MKPHHSIRRALTLIELLIVITILGMITAVTIPLMAPAIETRRLREAGRVFSSYLANAQTRAIASGRPVGVWIQPLSATSWGAMDLFIAEVPPPYSGEFLNSRMRITGGAADPGMITSAGANLNPDPGDDALHLQRIRLFDQVKLNYQGRTYHITGGSFDPTTYEMRDLPWRLKSADGGEPPPDTPDDGLPYQIFRQPTKTADTPVSLPDGAIIDIAYSGAPGVDVSGSVSEFRNNPSVLGKPVVILFGPSGAVEGLYIPGRMRGTLPEPLVKPNGPIFIHIGKSEKIGNQLNNTPEAADDPNFIDLQNLWVAVNLQTGLVTVSEVCPEIGRNKIPADGDETGLGPDGVSGTADDGAPLNINESRQFARSAQNIGGR